MKHLMYALLMNIILFCGANAQHELQSSSDGDNLNFVLKSTSQEFSDFWQEGNGGIRGLVAGSDVDQDGLYEIICSDYDDGGKVHVFEVSGDNQLQWVWTSSDSGSSSQTTCRYTTISDLDGNGKQEILFSICEQSGVWSENAGIHVYEWSGEDNQFGDKPLNATRVLSNLSRFKSDSFFAKDIDQDGKQELVIAINGDDDQDYFVILSVTGTFEGGDITWIEEARFSKKDQFKGDAINVLWCDMDGDNQLEVLAHSYHYMMILPIESDGPDQYSVGTAFSIDDNVNDVNLINGVATDLNQDGRDEVFYNGWKTGNLYLLSTDANTLSLDVSDVTLLTRGYAGDKFVSFGMSCGDQDHGSGSDGLDLYIGGGGYSDDLFDFEFKGGDMLDSSNYQRYIIYRDDTDGNALASRVVVPFADLDKDGNKELVLGYQSIPDSVNGQPVDKQWLRILEFDCTTPVEENSAWTVQMPQEMFLVKNYPNPFAVTTTFFLELQSSGYLKGNVYNIQGRKVVTLVNSHWHKSGKYSLDWNGMDDRGRVLPSGVYFAKFNLNGYQVTKKILIKR